MKEFLRQCHRRIQPRRRVRDTTVRLLGVEDRPVSRSRVEAVVDSSMEMLADLLRRIALREQTDLTASRVEKKYDRVAGSYIEKYYERIDERSVYWVDGQLRETSRQDHYLRMMNEYARYLDRVDFESALEVGAGELTTVAEMARRFGFHRDYHAIDLSLDRLRQGKKFFGEMGADIAACRANAGRLPYGDDSFDLVFTAHCLEHMPLDFREAIDEMVRVARRAVILFEPSYELGDAVQKLRMRANGYARGIGEYLRRLEGVTLWPADLMRNASAFNRTAVYGIELAGAGSPSRRDSTPPRFVCSECRAVLTRLNTRLRCDRCQLAYPVIDGVADLGRDAAYSVDSSCSEASRHSSSEEKVSQSFGA